ncbi:16S rRNA (uracil(1498)-N(3))-methyltransferase [Domibacillus epiphyticus]|uniref:Ribosomal RNA small subunit methyltransferase E n=1 Tax=Domibacillus epiphyticus TaxID=1714355 RepID=A0A1V2A9G1_9BACI|nr:16S rRNA (uracil(1498)-N(3))-methyltransferase [Domibacillus epiphyticus]OMP67631.1 16S rRNA (uracil(1498)-N(3))-methyltransferase [Domibacillus epiphyticus]
MQRYFLPDMPVDKLVTISGEDFHHISRVMRMEAGSRIYTVFPDGRTAIATITAIHEVSAEAEVTEWVEKSVELPADVVISCGLVKGDKFDYIIQKGTELGAAGFIPFEASRSVVKWDQKKGAKKTERWQKIAKEAAEQSHRTRIPAVSEPLSIAKVIESGKDFDIKLYAYEETAKAGDMSAFYEALHGLTAGKRVIVVSGPEGGLSDREAEQLTAGGFTACALGPRIMRAETAPLYVLSAISFYTELMR